MKKPALRLAAACIILLAALSGLRQFFHDGEDHRARAGWSYQPREDRRARAVRAAIEHAWRGYVEHAWGRDELLPLSRTGDDELCGMGATIVDSMSTLWLAGMREEFTRARDWVVGREFVLHKRCSAFEANIRIVGGLLSASALQGGDDALVATARTVADAIMPRVRCCGPALLADVGTFTLEFAELSRVTRNDTYARAATDAVRSLVAGRGSCIMISNSVLAESGASLPPCESSFGGQGDSFYEYLLKLSLLTHDEWAVAAWRAAVDGMVAHLVRCSTSGFPILGKTLNGTFVPLLEHLSCFVPGMLLLGGAVPSLAAGLLEGCLALYGTPTGLGADSASMRIAPPDARECFGETHVRRNTSAEATDVHSLAADNYQRPEVFESLFYFWRFTKDERYRDIAWDMFQAISKHQRVESGGFSESANVNSHAPAPRDRQRSFFIAESLKYLFLIFSPDSTLDLSKWVLTTEAHPLPIRGRRRLLRHR